MAELDEAGIDAAYKVYIDEWGEVISPVGGRMHVDHMLTAYLKEAGKDASVKEVVAAFDDLYARSSTRGYVMVTPTTFERLAAAVKAVRKDEPLPIHRGPRKSCGTASMIRKDGTQFSHWCKRYQDEPHDVHACGECSYTWPNKSAAHLKEAEVAQQISPKCGDDSHGIAPTERCVEKAWIAGFSGRGFDREAVRPFLREAITAYLMAETEIERAERIMPEGMEWARLETALRSWVEANLAYKATMQSGISYQAAVRDVERMLDDA